MDDNDQDDLGVSVADGVEITMQAWEWFSICGALGQLPRANQLILDLMHKIGDACGNVES